MNMFILSFLTFKSDWATNLYTEVTFLNLRSCLFKWNIGTHAAAIVEHVLFMILGHSFLEPDVIKDKLEPGVWFVVCWTN